MPRAARHAKWLTFPLLVTGLIALSAVDGQGQQPQGGGGFGGRGGFGGGPPDPDALWARMAQGKDSININDTPWMKGMMERNGDPIPPNGILTKDQFKSNYAKRLASGGGGGGGRGGFGGQAAPAVTMTVVPGQPPPAFGGGGGAPGADFAESRFRDMDKNKDGFVTLDEASDRFKPTFAQADKNGDGKVDLAEYKLYTAERFANVGTPGGMTGGMAPQLPPQDFSGATGSGRNRERPEEDAARVSVSRFGKLPKEVPGFFTEIDDDRDGMVGLYEWRRHGRKTAEFVEMDLNADGYLTADEWIRFNRIAIEKRATASVSDKSPADRGAATGERKGGDKGGRDRGAAPNPFVIK